MLFDSPILAAVAAPLLLWIAWLTRRPMRVVARSCARIAALLLWIALAGVELRRDKPPTIAVMVDVSPSTRGALLRDPQAVAARIAPLLAGRGATVHYFADGVQANDTESAVRQTRLEAPDADAIVLLSDGRFDAPPSLPPVFAVVDPSLDAPGDGRVTSVTAGEGASVSTSIDGGLRTLTIDGAEPARVKDVSGDRVIPLHDAAQTVRAALDGGDRWPENDAMSAISARVSRERWAIDCGIPGMRSVAAASVPQALGEYVSTSAIVLPANAQVGDATAAALRGYVEWLGGTLVVTGSPAAAPAALRAIAPLTATPPQPRGQWMILLDSSGSMAQSGRWPAALAAAEQAIRSLGANETVSLVTFNRAARVVADHQSPAAAIEALHALASVSPSGPTGLRAALETVADAKGGPTRVLLVTDGDADLGNTEELTRKLSDADAHVFAMLASSSAPIEALADRTGGAAAVQASPAGWIHALDHLAALGRSAEMPVASPIAGHGDLADDVFHATHRWQAWPRESATILAAVDNNPVMATWQAGLGRVISIAADLPAAEVRQITEALDRPSIDPCFTFDFDERAARVRITAIDQGRPMNGLRLAMRRGDRSVSLGQIAPGVYEAELPPREEATVAVVELDGRVITRRAVAGRYAQEFDVIGNDRAALQALAARTGGRLIDVGDNRPIDLPKIYERKSARTPAAFGGTLFMLAALLLLRMPYWEDWFVARVARWKRFRSFRTANVP